MAENANAVNDGFLTIGVGSLTKNYVYAAYFVPIANVFAALDALRSDILARANSSGFVWNFAAEMRFLRVTDDAELNVVPPGVYGAVELLALGATGSRGAADNQGWMKASPQDSWLRKFIEGITCVRTCSTRR